MDHKERYHHLQCEFPHLRKSVQNAGRNKEMWFKKKESLKEKIKILSLELQDLQSQQQNDSSSLKELKQQRDQYNSEVKKLISHIKEVKDEKERLHNRFQGKVSPDQVLQKITFLEKKVEMEVDFKKEQKLMEEIKKLKRQYDEGSDLQSLVEKERILQQHIRESRKKADTFHHKVLDINNQSGPAVFIKKVKTLVSLKKEQEEAFRLFIEQKNSFLSLQTQLKAIQKELAPLSLAFKEKPRASLRAEQKKSLVEQSQRVEEKIRLGKKLTTEDLLAFQGAAHVES